MPNLYHSHGKCCTKAQVRTSEPSFPILFLPSSSIYMRLMFCAKFIIFGKIEYDFRWISLLVGIRESACQYQQRTKTLSVIFHFLITSWTRIDIELLMILET